MNRLSSVDMRAIAPTVCRLLGVAPPDECEAGPVHEAVRSLSSYPRLALVVLDAVGESTLENHPDAAPFLQAITRVHLLHLAAFHPPTTPVNFASMATGLSPLIHSIRHREESIFHDTVFDALRRGGRTTAVGARRTSTLNILLGAKADEKIISIHDTDEEIVDAAEALLEEMMPDFFWFQFLDMDDAQHTYGTQSASTARVFTRTDTRLRHLCELLGELEYGVIICSDHGQHDREDTGEGTHDGTDPADTRAILTWYP